jgi:cytochrome b6-f complex iron-sulfur subunit
MHRRAFLSDIGLTMAAACTACLAACSKGDDHGGLTNPNNPPGGGNTNTTVNFNVALDTQILNVGDFVINGTVIVTRLAAANEVASFSAVSAKCTHQGGTLGFDNSIGKYVCPNHGSQFNPNGSVAQGPAAIALKTYTITLNGTTLNIKS